MNEHMNGSGTTLSVPTPEAPGGLLGMNGYQWTVLFAAWIGWGFDVFDGLLFNFVAPNCVPVLLGLNLTSANAAKQTLLWTGICTSVLLIGWALGGILFGRVADRIGRTKTLMLTMITYAIGTAACAAAPNIWVFLAFRFIASLGIGGEWAAGASLVAEVVPEKRRVEAGSLLYTSAAAGLFLAVYVNKLIAGDLFKTHPEVSWRYVFLFGLLPAAFAFLIRAFVKEPERWVAATAEGRATIAELFKGPNLRLVISGLIPALIALITWWSCNAFLPVFAKSLAAIDAKQHGLDKGATQHLIEAWKGTAIYWFTWGGLLGTLLTIPAAKFLGRRMMFAVFFALSGAAVLAAFGHEWPPETRLFMWFPIGITTFGVFGAFPFYLPELFPTRLRATGSGFCYNFGRIVTAAGPLIVGSVASQGANTFNSTVHALYLIGFVPLIGLLFLPFVIETKGRELTE